MKKTFTTLTVILISLAVQAQNFLTDSLFGENGIIKSATLGGIEGNSANIFIQPDGKLLLCGYIYDIGANAYYNVMFRTDGCGNIDSSFGVNGLVRHTYDQRNIGAYYVLLPNGKIVAAGTQSDGNSGSQQFPFIGRYNSDGSVDSSFATNGTNKISNLGPQIFTLLLLLPDGKFLCSNGSNLIMRFDTSGAVDNTFGTNGVVQNPVPPGVNFFYDFRSVQRSDGKIISAACAYQGINNDKVVVLCAYDTLGAIDSAYGSNGFYIDNNFVLGSTAPRLILQSNDKVIAARQNLSETAIIIARYNTNGSLDSTFGTFGYINIPGISSPTRLEYVSNFNDDSFIIGYSDGGVASKFLKYTPDGIADTLFSLDGSNFFQFPGALEKADLGLSVTDNELILCSSSAFNNGSMCMKKFVLNSAMPDITQIGSTLNANVNDTTATLQWYLNGSAITGAIDSTYLTTQNGTYMVEVTNSLGCMASDTLIVTNTSIIENNTINGVSFYPNPFSNNLKVRNTSGKEITVKLIDLTGKTIASLITGEVQNEMSLTHIAKGVYILEIQSENSIMKNRIVKQ